MSGVKRQKVFWDDGGETLKRFYEVDAVLASDYDRDTQALRDELNACKSPPGGCGYWRESARLREAERDALRVQVEEMRALLAGVCDYADDLLTDVNRAWSYCGSTGADEVHKDADYLAARAALQAKP